MYKIKVTAQRGKGKIRRMESAENYTTAEAVAAFRIGFAVDFPRY